MESLFSLHDKTVVLTGAAGYFGRSFSKCLADAGAHVVLLGRGSKIKRLAEEIGVDYLSVDFYDTEDYKECLESINDVDVLINNAYEFSKNTGFNDQSGKLENMSKEQWNKSFESGVYWHALATQVLGEKMKQKKSGSIINISSMYALVAPDPSLYEGKDAFNPPSYGAAKAAILALTRYTASFYGEYGIRCNAIVPGSFPNTSTDSYNSPNDEEFLQRLRDRTVLGRTGRLEDLHGALIFLASDASSYMTGQSVVIDGGWTIR
ncbi:hypothetical protein LCGC14_0530420 [marine sediment metagenome]|uniref:Gluconate 5-dehydrogenase n=1 Tax=marine sediment metagenome TaxID=412755 RepID=A0A0F9SE63_9ZZZZ